MIVYLRTPSAFDGGQKVFETAKGWRVYEDGSLDILNEVPPEAAEREDTDRLATFANGTWAYIVS
jgi:hypothetical protein